MINPEQLERDELVAVISGTTPSYDQMNKLTAWKAGNYCGGFVDEWRWDKFQLSKKEKMDLIRIYNYLKNID